MREWAKSGRGHSGHAGTVLAQDRGKVLQAPEEVECIGLVGAKSQKDEAGNLRKGLIVM